MRYNYETKPEVIELIITIILEMMVSPGPKTNKQLCDALEEITPWHRRILKNRISLALFEAGNLFENITGKSWALSKDLFKTSLKSI